jgi:penicillin-binding protein 1A
VLRRRRHRDPHRSPIPKDPLNHLPELPDIPVDIEGTDVRINEGEGVTVNTEVGGVPLEVNFGREGVNVQPKERNSPETR